MGLDMYLIKRKNGDKKLSEEIMYWRKANHIHKWFVDKCNDGEMENCEYIKVNKENLEELKDTCEELLEKVITKEGKVKNGETFKEGKWEPNWENGTVIINTEVCEELLPTQSGFFFGGTDYNEYYLYDVENTLKGIEEILETFDFQKDELYYSAWW